MPGSCASASARKRALAWSSRSRCGDFFERDQSGRGQHARLPHSAAQPLAIAAGAVDDFARPTSMEPTGAPRPFDRQNITESACAASSRTSRPSASGGVEDARAIQMHRQAARRARGRRSRRDIHADRPCRRPCCACFRSRSARWARGSARLRADERLDAIPGEDAVFDVGRRAAGSRKTTAAWRSRNRGCAPRSRRSLPGRARCAVLIAMVCPWCRWARRGRLPSEDFGGAGLQAIDRRIFAVDVVADFGFGHGAPHLGRGRVTVSLRRSTVVMACFSGSERI